jgi:hypothetical protein
MGETNPLAAGMYTIVARYISQGVSSPGTNHAEFGRRNLTVLPY